MRVDESAFQIGVHLALVRVTAAFGPPVLELDTAEPQQLLRNVLEEYNDAERRIRTRFITIFVDLALSGYVARQITGDDHPQFDTGMLRRLRDTLLDVLNSWTHEDD